MDATTNLVELKRVLDKVNQDIEVLKARLDLREGGGGDGSSVVDAMDLDDRAETVEPEGDSGRAQSVLSARSTRSRKNVDSCSPHLLICTDHSFQARRSMSVSSVDTSVNSRPATKRQKRV